MKTKLTVLWHIYKNWHIYDRFVILKWQIYDWYMKMTDLWHNCDSFMTDKWLFYANDSFVTDLWQIYDRFMRLAGPTFNKSTDIALSLELAERSEDIKSSKLLSNHGLT